MMNMEGGMNIFDNVKKQDDIYDITEKIIDNVHCDTNSSLSQRCLTENVRALLNSTLLYLHDNVNESDHTYDGLIRLLKASLPDESNCYHPAYETDYDILLEYLQYDKDNPLGKDHPAIQWYKQMTLTGKMRLYVVSAAITTVYVYCRDNGISVTAD